MPLCLSATCISIHALREEGDGENGAGGAVKGTFLSTPSARRATSRRLFGGEVVHISIHALREEGDITAREYDRKARGISIHALREEGDHSDCFAIVQDTHFYPRPPRGGRPDKRVCKGVILIISIHALREEGDRSQSVP